MSSLDPSSSLPASIVPAQERVSDADVALMSRVLQTAAQRPQSIPEALMAYILDYIQANNLTIPIGQISGFTQYGAQLVSVGDNQTTSSTAYIDLATVGPDIAGLSKGSYVIVWGGAIWNTTGLAYMGVSVNGDSAQSRSVDARAGGANQTSVVAASLETLSLDSNDVIAKYRADSGTTGHFNNRWLLALKVANL